MPYRATAEVNINWEHGTFEAEGSTVQSAINKVRKAARANGFLPGFSRGIIYIEKFDGYISCEPHYKSIGIYTY